jgi:hypothetical protein
MNNKDKITLYQFRGKTYVDSNGAADMLKISVTYLRNMVHAKKAPPSIKKGRNLYFEKVEVEKFIEEKTMVKIKDDI